VSGPDFTASPSNLSDAVNAASGDIVEGLNNFVVRSGAPLLTSRDEIDYLANCRRDDNAALRRLRRHDIETRMRTLDELLLSEGGKAARGGAIGTKPDPGWRKFLREWWKVQWPREAAAEAKSKDGWWLEGEDCEEPDDPPKRAERTVSTASRKFYSTQAERGRAKGYAAWNPHKRTRVIMAQVKEILAEYRAELPLTARQIFYRLVGKYGYPKTEGAYESLTNHLVRARRSRMVPFDSIRDDGASVMKGKFYSGEEDFYRYINDQAKGYERDKLARQNRNIRVYVESAGMMPQLERVTRLYSVPVYSCSGFDSLTAKFDLAEDVAKAQTYRGRQTVILHLGDMDPSGETIFDAISEDVYAFLEVDIQHKRPEDIAIFKRVALTERLVELYDLPTDPVGQLAHGGGSGHPSFCVPAFSPAVELLGEERHFLCPLGRCGLVSLPRTMSPMSGGVLWFPPPAPPDSSLWPRRASLNPSCAAFALGRSYVPRSS